MKHLSITAPLILIALSFAACSEPKTHTAPPHATLAKPAAFIANKSLAENLRDAKTMTAWVKLLDFRGFLDQYNTQDATMFVPRDDAFAQADTDYLAMIYAPENRDKRIYLITEHMSGNILDIKSIRAHIKSEGGTYPIATSRGTNLIFTEDALGIKLMNPEGYSAYIVQADLRASNGIVHVIDTVLVDK